MKASAPHGRVLSLGALLIATFASADWSGSVVGVQDGDTLEIMRGDRSVHVRLVEIDAPEKPQPFGSQSKQSLSALTYGKQADVREHGQDKYQRTLGRVTVSGVDVNAEQVRRGMAWAYRKYLTDTNLLAMEERARSAGLGLWADPNPIPPWDFRHPENVMAVADKRGAAKPTQRQPKGEGADKPGKQPSCGTKRYCKNMSSCAEARHYMTECGRHDFDRDGDGIPCENVCGKR